MSCLARGGFNAWGWFVSGEGVGLAGVMSVCCQGAGEMLVVMSMGRGRGRGAGDRAAGGQVAGGCGHTGRGPWRKSGRSLKSEWGMVGIDYVHVWGAGFV